MSRQVDRMAASLVQETPYKPFALAGDDGVMDALDAMGFDPDEENANAKLEEYD